MPAPGEEARARDRETLTALHVSLASALSATAGSRGQLLGGETRASLSARDVRDMVERLVGLEQTLPARDNAPDQRPVVFDLIEARTILQAWLERPPSPGGVLGVGGLRRALSERGLVRDIQVSATEVEQVDARLRHLQERTRPRTALDDLAWIREHGDDIHAAILHDPLVQQAGLAPTRRHVQTFFDLFQAGVGYMHATYGPDALLARMRLHTPTTPDDMRRELMERPLMGYIPAQPGGQDEIAMSFYHVASACVNFGRQDWLRQSEHLPPGYAVREEGLASLVAIEECGHCYEIRHLGVVKE